MYINDIALKNYRNISEAYIELSPGVNIIYGDNAQGKTNILESIYICSAGRSQRSGVNDRDIIAFNRQEAHIRLNVTSANTDRIDIHFNSSKKKFISVNGISIQKLGELFGVLNTVFFGPQDLQLIQSGPGERRRFMDMELCQINNIYYYNLKKYYRLLKQRNNLLKTLQKDRRQYDMLDIYDLQLSQCGIKLLQIRENFIKELNGFAANMHGKISQNSELLSIVYKPNTKQEDYLSKLSKNHERDIMLGSTSSGVHKDDIAFYINGVNARSFGSQGQQRSACISAKLAEIELITSERGESPVLLLDDVLSELDGSRQKCLINSIGNIQTVITCTGIEDYIKDISVKSKIFNVKNGKVL